MHYYQHHIGDFIKATARLSDAQSMAYLRLLWMYYDSEKPLKPDVKVLAFQIGASVEETEMLLEAFFWLAENGWHHTRCDQEIAEYRSFLDKKSNAGKASAERRKNIRSTGVEQVLDSSSTGEQLTTNHKPITSITVSKDTVSPPTGEHDEKQNLKILGCDHKGVLSLYHTTLPNLPHIEIWNDTRAGYLRQRWREVAIDLSKNGAVSHADMLAWWKQFFEHIRSSKFLTGKTQSKDKPPFLADLEWIIKPTNFAKIIEGKYHRD